MSKFRSTRRPVNVQIYCFGNESWYRVKKLFDFVIAARVIDRDSVLGHVFFILWNCSFFMGIIFCSSVTLVWTFNIRNVCHFITKKANIPVKLVSFFNDASFLFCRFLKSGVTNELNSLFLLKDKKSQNYLFQTEQNFAARKTLVWSACVWRTATAAFFKK